MHRPAEHSGDDFIAAHSIVSGSRPGRVYASIALLVALAAGACGSDFREAEGLERVRTHGLRVGYSIEPPYALVDAAGQPTGEAPEIARYVARELDIATIQWYPLPFAELIPALLAGRIDIIASGLFVTPGRSELVRFSTPTTCVRPVLLVRRGNALMTGSGSGRGTSCERCRLAVVHASVEQRALARDGHFELFPVPDAVTGAVAVAEGSADALAISAPTARAFARRDSTLVLHEHGLPDDVVEAAQGCAALAFRPTDQRVVMAVDSVLRDFIGSAAHRRMVMPFGFEESEIAAATTVSRPGAR